MKQPEVNSMLKMIENVGFFLGIKQARGADDVKGKYLG